MNLLLSRLVVVLPLCTAAAYVRLLFRSLMTDKLAFVLLEHLDVR